MLKHGDTFAVFDRFGDIAPARRASRGSTTRAPASSRASSFAWGERPLLLSSTRPARQRLLAVDLTNPDLYATDAVVPQGHAARLPRSSSCGEARAYERIRIAQLRARAVAIDSRARLRRRLRRHLRGARHAASAARRRDLRRSHRRPRDARLSRARRRRRAARACSCTPAAVTSRSLRRSGLTLEPQRDELTSTSTIACEPAARDRRRCRSSTALARRRSAHAVRSAERGASCARSNDAVQRVARAARVPISP